MNRPSFITASVGVATLASATRVISNSTRQPLILSTWDHGQPANMMALQTLAQGGSVLDTEVCWVRGLTRPRW